MPKRIVITWTETCPSVSVQLQDKNMLTQHHISPCQSNFLDKHSMSLKEKVWEGHDLLKYVKTKQEETFFCHLWVFEAQQQSASYVTFTGIQGIEFLCTNPSFIFKTELILLMSLQVHFQSCKNASSLVSSFLEKIRENPVLLFQITFNR